MAATAVRRGGRRSRRHARGPGGNARASLLLSGILREVLDEAAALLEMDDPLEVELWASSLIGVWHGAPLAEEDPDEVIGGALVRRAGRSRKPEALALLLALAATAEPPLAALARGAARRLRAEGVPEPPWAGQVGRAEFLEGWRVGHAYGDGEVVLASFRHQGFEPHLLGVLIDHNLGGIARGALVGRDGGRGVEAWRGDPEFSIQPIGAAEVAGRVLAGIGRADGHLDPPVNEGYRRARALLASRMRSLPGGWEEPTPAPLCPEDRAELVADFLASAEAKGLAAAEDVAETIVDYGCDYGTGDPLRWSPAVVELYLCDWYPRKVIQDRRVARRVPEVLGAWVRYAGRRRGLPAHLVEETLRAVRACRREFRRAVRDPGRFGPAKSLVLAMRADGVDLTSQEAVDAWIEAFNARPLEERRRILPH